MKIVDEIGRCFKNLGHRLLKRTGILAIMETQKKWERENYISFSMLVEAAHKKPPLSMDRRILVASGLEHLTRNIIALGAPQFETQDYKKELVTTSTTKAIELRQLASGVPLLEKLADAVLRDFYRFSLYESPPIGDVVTKIERTLPNLREETAQDIKKLGKSQVPQALYDAREALGCYSSNNLIPDSFLSEKAADLLRTYKAQRLLPQPQGKRDPH
jgi:hypothetical protein